MTVFNTMGIVNNSVNANRQLVKKQSTENFLFKGNLSADQFNKSAALRFGASEKDLVKLTREDIESYIISQLAPTFQQIIGPPPSELEPGFVLLGAKKPSLPKLTTKSFIYALVNYLVDVTHNVNELVKVNQHAVSSQEKNILEQLFSVMPKDQKGRSLNQKAVYNVMLNNFKEIKLEVAAEKAAMNKAKSSEDKGIRLSEPLAALLNAYVTKHPHFTEQNIGTLFDFILLAGNNPNNPQEIQDAGYLVSYLYQDLENALKNQDPKNIGGLTIGNKADKRSPEAYMELLEKKKQFMTETQYTEIADTIDKLANSSPHEASNIENRLDVLLKKIPWKATALSDSITPKNVMNILDKDHYGLEKPKAEVVKSLAPQIKAENLKKAGFKVDDKNIKPTILCFVGSPGIGKTSLGKSIARSLDRKFVRLALGGIKDESDVRGHRPTYIGALIGKVMKALQNAGTNNPVIMLDEVDKLKDGGLHGDPAAALLEVLDPEQNKTFEDHYLDMPYDLSKVMFICTANSLKTIPDPLRDRMKVIELHGYLTDEKIEIAKKFLIPQIRENNFLNREYYNMDKEPFNLSDEVLRYIIQNYCPERGVRQLEYVLDDIAKQILLKEEQWRNGVPIEVTLDNLKEFIDSPKYPLEKVDPTPVTGRMNGLFFSTGARSGGTMPIDVAYNIKKGVSSEQAGLVLQGISGNMKDVMKESAQRAFAYVDFNAKKLGITEDNDLDLDKNRVKVHIGTAELGPKDGPSAGAAFTVALISKLLNKPIPGDLAMTGAFDLRGNVLAIGGVREKLSGAYEEGIKTVLIPEANRNDVEDVPQKIREALDIHYVKNIDEVLDIVFKNSSQSNEQKQQPELTIVKPDSSTSKLDLTA